LRFIYTLLLYLLTPLVLLRLLWRGKKAPAYRQRWSERFGFTPFRIEQPCIWFHTVSVGETMAALPLIRAIMAQYPETPVLVTTTTPTGSQQVLSSFGDAVSHCYIPYDLPLAVAIFLRRINPRIFIVMETELWPNLFHACRRGDVPVIVVNTRLSERSAARYRRFAALTKETLTSVRCFAVQHQSDADRLLSLGAQTSAVKVTGNIKFDITLSPDLSEQAQFLRHDWGESRPVWIAASTHEGEDEQILQALKQIRSVLPDILLVLVPRHPERFSKVVTMCCDHGYSVVRRSDGRPCDSATGVFVGDSMGELCLFYAAADVAFVGGSLVATGGHNVLEPAALGKPVIFGPHMFNFSEAGRLLLENDAAKQVDDSDQLAKVVINYLLDVSLRQSSGERAIRVIKENSGALHRTTMLIAELLNAKT